MSDETRVALLEQNMTEIKQEMAEIKADIKTVSKQIDTLMNTKITDHIQMKNEVNDISNRLKKLERQNNLWKWLTPSITFFIGSIFVFLVSQYLQHLK